MRRSDRELTDLCQLISLIGQSPYMHLALVDGDKPYVLPLNFGFEERAGSLRFYFHGALEGRKAALIARNPACSLSFVPRYELVAAATACGHTARYASVLVEGQVRLITDEAERRHALDLLMQQLGHAGPSVYQPQILDRTSVYCIETVHISGKASGLDPAS